MIHVDTSFLVDRVQIGTMDLLIGTAALEGGVPLVTRNRKDLEKIPSLDVLTS